MVGNMAELRYSMNCQQMSREQQAFCAMLKNATNEGACVASEYVGMFSRAYFMCCLVMGAFFCVSYFLVRKPHFIVLSCAQSTTNVFTSFMMGVTSCVTYFPPQTRQCSMLLKACSFCTYARIWFVRRSSQSIGVAAHLYRIGKTTQPLIIYGPVHD